MRSVSAKPLRCAVYTRKSTEHGLEQEFNSLDAQREACEAYVKSQAHEGWRLMPEHYDDGGFSGGSMERPALQGWQSPADLLANAVERVIVRAGAVEIVPKLTKGNEARSSILVPWSPPRRARRVVIGAVEETPVQPIRAETRARLVEGIARARRWLEDLITGRMKDTREIAKIEGCSERSVRMTLNLAFLAPEIAKAAVDGTLADGLGSSRLVDAPTSWRDQRRTLSLVSGRA